MKDSTFIVLGLMASLASLPAFASTQGSTVPASSAPRAAAKKAAVAECKKEGLIGKKLDDCVKNKTESK